MEMLPNPLAMKSGDAFAGPMTDEERRIRLFGEYQLKGAAVKSKKRAVIEMGTVTFWGGQFRQAEINALMDAHEALFPGVEAVIQVGRKSRAASEQIPTGL